jgi:RND family efflux transporter MFP subunit
MLLTKKAVALSAGFLAALSVATLAQNAPLPPRGPGGTAQTLELDELATLEWIEKADVAALREGVIETVELWPGMPVVRGGVIGTLHKETAELTVAKAKVAASNVAAEEKALAQRELALTVVATNKRLNERRPGMVSIEEQRKAEAEVKVADAMAREAVEQRELNKAEMSLAVQAVKEHTIVAPFDGIVYERLKNPGESVRANEAVVRLGNLDKLRAWSYIPLEFFARVKEGQIVELQPRLQGTVRGGGRMAIEQKRYRGKITFVDPQIQPVAETAVRIYAEFENKDHELRPGLKGALTIYLTPDAAPAAVQAPPAVGIRTASPALLPR